MSEGRRRGDLIDALLSDYNHRTLYLSNAEFRASVEFLAGMLPGAVEGMAEAAEWDARERRLTLKSLRNEQTLDRWANTPPGTITD